MKKIITVIIICGAVLTLTTLGTWQVQRLSWKQDIIKNLDAEYQKDPTKHVYNFEDLSGLEENQNPILYGSIRGRFSRRPAFFLEPRTHDGKVGAHIIHQFNLENGGAIFVNRGWIEKKNYGKFFVQSHNDLYTIEGIFRKPDWNRFTSNNSPSQNIWTKADINQMAEHYKIERIAPVMLYATAIEHNQNLILQDAKWYPRNKHLQYAIFWYGMIFVLLGLVAIAVSPKKKVR